MKLGAASTSFFIGWDVGGWNCDDNRKSRDAIVILDESLVIVGNPWHGNLRKCIAAATTSRDWLKALFANCKATFPTGAVAVTMAIDTPLGFSEVFVALITQQGCAEPVATSGLNRYLFRHTELIMTISIDELRIEPVTYDNATDAKAIDGTFIINARLLLSTSSDGFRYEIISIRLLCLAY